MLKLKPNCECCGKDLPADSTEVIICTFECTFFISQPPSHDDRTVAKFVE